MRNVLIKFPAGKRKPTYLIPTLTHRLTLISKGAFEGAFFANKIVIDSPCLIHPSAFAGIQNLRWVVFTSGGAVSCFADEPSVDWGDFAFEIVASMAQNSSSSLLISKAYPHCSQSKCGGYRQSSAAPLTSLLSLAATGSLTAASSGRRSAGVSSALLVAALIDRLHVRNLHEMFPP